MENPGSRTAPMPANAVAHAIATARTLVGYSLEGGARAIGINEALLRDLEAGVLEVNEEMRQLIEEAYGIRLAKLASQAPANAPRIPLSYDAALGVLRVGSLGVRFRLGLDDNDVLLRGFSSAVRRQRQVPPSVPLQLRKADLNLLSTLLNLDDEDLDERARFWFGQTTQTAQSFRAMLRLAKPIEEGEVGYARANPVDTEPNPADEMGDAARIAAYSDSWIH